MNFDPIHWLAAGLAVALLLTLSIGGGMYWKHYQDLRVCNAEFIGFKADTAAKSEASVRETEHRENQLATAATNIQGDLNNALTKLAASYADNERLRLNAAKGNTSGKQAPSLASAATRLNCPNGSTDLARRLEQIEAGNVKLLKRGDEAIIRTIACKKYTDELQIILVE